ncbi:Peptide chain release factor 1 [Hypsizygus marmoreus]|uniref:Peptide chain release factor 1 n=1 Tax=Hypsizygus marmoreus TaxID=39966 RepID=A0A369JWG9_HYPMA|nr:Peptide chain release factor 1 [Hypsizygus marmoreus]
MLLLSRCLRTPAKNLRRFVPQRPFHDQADHKNVRIVRILEKRIEERKRLFSELSEEMSSPDDISRLKQLKESEPLQVAWDDLVRTRQLLNETDSLLSDSDEAMRALAVEEHDSLGKSLAELVETTIPSLLIPPSTTSHLSAMLELKSGVGGSEASLFLSNLLRMYLRLSNVRRWKANVVSQNDSDGGGIKDAIVEVKGEGVFEALRWESGVHRVQRVPATEASGRVHTSTVAIIVLPLMEETDNHNEELFNMEDVKIEVMRSRGAGGQHVNKTESAVRLTHIPTGITVSMQDERSQHQNKRRAFTVLRSRLMDQKLTREIAERRATRQNLVRTADRSEKIRTYNYAQERVTDHRIGLTLKNLSSVLEGDGLQDFLDALQKDHDETVLEDMLSGD